MLEYLQAMQFLFSTASYILNSYKVGSGQGYF